MIILAEHYSSLKNTYDKHSMFDKLLKMQKKDNEKEKELLSNVNKNIDKEKEDKLLGKTNFYKDEIERMISNKQNFELNKKEAIKKFIGVKKLDLFNINTENENEI
jgi:hypothetical protein